jgi:hypothetical protein
MSRVVLNSSQVSQPSGPPLGWCAMDHGGGIPRHLFSAGANSRRVHVISSNALENLLLTSVHLSNATMTLN